jgi:hypothetical protein
MTREEAYRKEPELAAITDFMTQHEKKLKKLHKKYQKDTGNKIEFVDFVVYVYHNAQDLIINPEDN